MLITTKTTIAAIATPPGRGGIGVIRISGEKVASIAQALLGSIPVPRYARYGAFLAKDGSVLDEGIALYFPNPHSFTGEDVLELQGHGGPVIQDLLLKEILHHGAILARPGEFSERAFLNGKIDLVQAEAIADLIAAASEQAAHSALRSLQGEFSQRIHAMVDMLVHLRAYVEAAIDFPEEEIDFLSDPGITQNLENILHALQDIQASAQQGVLLRDGMTVVIAGRPNVGKSSLLNQLSGQDSAIVTDIAGTTRDILREHIHIDGLPLHIIDTAGLRNSSDPVEQEGIRRAQDAMQKADRLLLVVDGTQDNALTLTELLTELADFFPQSFPAEKITIVHNKMDLLQESSEITLDSAGHTLIKLSAKTGMGMDLLRQHLKSCLGFSATTENLFSARRRHLEALNIAYKHVHNGKQQLQKYRAGELLAEELRLAQNALGEITGVFLPDDLLGEIFGRFCIGK